MGFRTKISYNTLMEENQQSNSPTDNVSPSLPQTEANIYEPPAAVADEGLISWSSVEFIEHKKPLTWFLVFGLVVVGLAVAIYFFAHSIFPPIMFVLIGVVFAIIAARPPKTLQYELSNRGIQIGNRFNSYNEFKSFSVIDEQAIGSITFNPFKRFTFPTAIYYELTDEDKILTLVSQYLPHVEAPKDPVDQLMRKLHF